MIHTLVATWEQCRVRMNAKKRNKNYDIEYTRNETVMYLYIYMAGMAVFLTWLATSMS